MTESHSRRGPALYLLLVVAALPLFTSAAGAQTPAGALQPGAALLLHEDPSALPSSPEPQAKNAPTATNKAPTAADKAPNATDKAPDPRGASHDPEHPQTKRIMGIMPNFGAVSSTEVLPPQSAKEKFLTASANSFDYSAVFIPAVLATGGVATRSYPQFGDGLEAYGNYFWRAAVDQSVDNYMVKFVVPVTAHQDPRYYRLGHGGFVRRTGYAMSRALVTRSDHARPEFNVSEVLGSGLAAAISSTYYPSSSRDFSSVGAAWALDIGIDALSMVAKEFWPDINHRLLHTRAVPAN